MLTLEFLCLWSGSEPPRCKVMNFWMTLLYQPLSISIIIERMYEWFRASWFWGIFHLPQFWRHLSESVNRQVTKIIFHWIKKGGIVLLWYARVVENQSTETVNNRAEQTIRQLKKAGLLACLLYYRDLLISESALFCILELEPSELCRRRGR